MAKVAAIYGLAGACCREELANITVDDIEDKRTLIIVKIPDLKNYS